MKKVSFYAIASSFLILVRKSSLLKEKINDKILFDY